MECQFGQLLQGSGIQILRPAPGVFRTDLLVIGPLALLLVGEISETPRRLYVDKTFVSRNIFAQLCPVSSEGGTLTCKVCIFGSTRRT